MSYFLFNRGRFLKNEELTESDLDSAIEYVQEKEEGLLNEKVTSRFLKCIPYRTTRRNHYDKSLFRFGFAKRLEGDGLISKQERYLLQQNEDMYERQHIQTLRGIFRMGAKEKVKLKPSEVIAMDSLIKCIRYFKEKAWI